MQTKLHFSLQLQHSQWASAYIVFIHILLIAVFFLVPLSAVLNSGFVVLLLIHAFYCLWRYNSKAAYFWVSHLEYRRQHWRITRNNRSSIVRFKQVTVWNWLIIINFISEDSPKIQSLAIFPDSGDKELLRQLRVILRHFPLWDD